MKHAHGDGQPPAGISSLLAVAADLWAGLEDGRLLVWHGHTEAQLHASTPHSDRVSCLALVGAHVWSGSADRTILAHDAASFAPLYSLGDQGRALHAARCSHVPAVQRSSLFRLLPAGRCLHRGSTAQECAGLRRASPLPAGGFVKAMVCCGWAVWTCNSKSLRVLASDGPASGHQATIGQLQQQLQAAEKRGEALQQQIIRSQADTLLLRQQLQAAASSAAQVSIHAAAKSNQLLHNMPKHEPLQERQGLQDQLHRAVQQEQQLRSRAAELHRRIAGERWLFVHAAREKQP